MAVKHCKHSWKFLTREVYQHLPLSAVTKTLLSDRSVGMGDKLRKLLMRQPSGAGVLEERGAAL